MSHTLQTCQTNFQQAVYYCFQEGFWRILVKTLFFSFIEERLCTYDEPSGNDIMYHFLNDAGQIYRQLELLLPSISLCSLRGRIAQVFLSDCVDKLSQCDATRNQSASMQQSLHQLCLAQSLRNWSIFCWRTSLAVSTNRGPIYETLCISLYEAHHASEWITKPSQTSVRQQWSHLQVFARCSLPTNPHLTRLYWLSATTIRESSNISLHPKTLDSFCYT